MRLFSGGLMFLFLLLSTPGTLLAQAGPLMLDLESAIAMAREKNPGLQISALEVDRAGIAIDAARGNFLPSLNAQAGYNRNIKKPVIFLPPGSPFGDVLEIGSDNSYSAAFAASVPVYNPALNAQLQAARVEKELAGEQYRASRIELNYFVQSAFFDALLAKESMEVMRLSHQQASENLEQVKKMHRQGIVAEYDLIRAQVQTENLRPNVLQAEVGYDMALSYLKVLIGLDLSRETVLQGDLSSLSEQMLSSFNVSQASRSLQENTDLNQLGLQIKLLGEQQRNVRAAGLPSLNLSGAYNFQTEANDFVFADYTWVETFSAGLRLTIPIFNGLAVKRQVQQLEIAGQQLRLQKDYMEDNLNVQLENILQSMAVAVEKSRNAQSTALLAERGFNIARARYDTGQGTLLEVNDSELALTQARFNLLQAKHEILKAKTEYDKFIGQN